MIIADTGFWVALFNHKDTFYHLAYQRLGELNEPLLVTLPVVTETCYLTTETGRAGKICGIFTQPLARCIPNV